MNGQSDVSKAEVREDRRDAYMSQGSSVEVVEETNKRVLNTDVVDSKKMGSAVVSDNPDKEDVSQDWRLEKKFVDMYKGTELDGIREKLFSDRYAMKDEDGKPMEKYPEQTWKRVAWALAQVEKTSEKKDEWEEKFYEAMQDFKFCPAGRFLTSAGTGTDTTMINCFVIPNPEDTRKGIIKTLEQVTEISARGGGVGFNLSSLRPRGSYLQSINGTSSGAVSWANLYSVAAHDIIQQGGTRRGALMIMLWDWHPDVEEFITVKQDMSKILGANLSVCVSDGFMEAVDKDREWELTYPDTEHEAYRTDWDGDIYGWMEKGLPVKVYKKVRARELWDAICDSAWKSAEPGVVFLERTNKMNNTWYFEKNISTNPCGEQPLPAWGVCNLSSINLSPLVKDGAFDYEEFEELVRVGVRFLDNAVDGEKYLYPEIEKRQMDERRIGLGVIGLADALIKMKVRYGSKESLEILDKMFRTLRDTAYEYSVELAQEKGAFPKFDAQKYLESGFMMMMPESIREKVRANGIRNALLLTMAPTGKISLLAGVNSGIEPVFSFSYQQQDRLGMRRMYNPLFKKWMESAGFDPENEDDFADAAKKAPEYFVVADDLTPEDHVRVQGLIQKYTDSAISKTVNAPETHTVEDVKKLYSLAYELGCKGISYFRDGSREATLIRDKKDSQEQKDKETKRQKEEEVIDIPVSQWDRPLVVTGRTYRMKTPVGTAFITVNSDDDGNPVEVFVNVGKAGSEVQAMAEGIGRLISKTLSMGAHLSGTERVLAIVEQLKGIGGMRSVGFGPNRIMSLPDALAKALSMEMGLISGGRDDAKATTGNENGNGKANHQVQLALNGGAMPVIDSKSTLDHVSHKADICPECGGASLVHEEGCGKCYGCGFSAC